MKKPNVKHSKIGYRLLCFILPKREHYSALGDLDELYSEIAEREGNGKAMRWYWFQIMRTLPKAVNNSIIWSMEMFKNYLKISFRNLKKHKGFSFINIFGLSMGIALFIFVISFVLNELSYDRFHKNLDRIYIVGLGEHNGTPGALADYLKSRIPEIQETVRFRYNYGSDIFKYSGESYKIERSYLVDHNIFDVFSFELLAGNPETALKDPFSLVLAESESKRIFGDENPLGKVLDCSGISFKVTGIMKDIHSNSSIYCTAFSSFSTLDKTRNEIVSRNWSSSLYQTFLLYPENHEFSEIDSKMKHVAGELFDSVGMTEAERARSAVSLRPMKSHYFDRPRGGQYIHGSLRNVYLFAAVAFLILVVAAINFVNLSTARSSTRANEVGMRKVLGSQRSELVRQFLTESVIMSFIATFLACCIVLLLQYRFYNVIGKNLEFSIFQYPVNFLYITGGAFLLGFISGIYPSFYLAAFQPIQILKEKNLKSSGRGTARKVLSVFQFTVSIILIFGTITINKQLRFVNYKDLGFDKDKVLWFETNREVRGKMDVFKTKLLSNPAISGFAMSNYTKPGIFSKWGRQKEGRMLEFHVFLADADYVETMGLQIVNGRDFSEEMPTDINRAFILNETAIREFGFESPIGETMGNNVVVGVVKDFYFLSLHHEIEPLVIAYMPQNCEIANIKISSQNTGEAIAYIRSAWEELAHGYPFEYHFYDESFEQLYQSDQKFQQLFLYFSLLAIIISCLGLLGLASFMADQRTKEIGIRKVLGSSNVGIFILLNKEFMKWVIAANIIALPAAWYLMNNWMQNFAYKTAIGATTFFVTCLITLLIALVTVGYKSMKTARINPVESIKNE